MVRVLRFLPFLNIKEADSSRMARVGVLNIKEADSSRREADFLSGKEADFPRG